MIKTGFALIGILCAAVAHSASFDCGKASSQVEKAICSDAVVSALDETLSARYKAALSQSPQPGELKAAQKLWLKEVRNACPDAACLKSAYRERVAALTTGVSSSTEGSGFTGTYRAADGELRVLQQAQRIKFQVATTTGMNTADAAGEAKLIGNTADYADPDLPCRVSLKFSANSADVADNGECGGMNASLSGHYKLTSHQAPHFDQ